MTRIGIALVLAVGMASVATGRPPAQSGEPAPVVLDVIVSDVNGVPVAGLAAADFEVRSDSRLQIVSSVSADPQPLSVVLLIDVSESANSLWRPSVANVATTLAGALRPGDRARLGGVAAHLTLGPWAADAAALLRSTGVLTPANDDQFGPSPLWDAVDTALDALASEPSRRTIVLLTDGRASGNVHGLDDVRVRAATLGVSVNVIAGWTGVTGVAGTLLRQLAATSGGLAVVFGAAPSSSREMTVAPLGPLADRLLADLRTCYRVGFVPDRADGAAHAVDVRVKRPELRTRTREQYVAGG